MRDTAVRPKTRVERLGGRLSSSLLALFTGVLLVAAATVAGAIVVAGCNEPDAEVEVEDTEVLYFENLARGIQATFADTVATELVLRDSAAWAAVKDSLRAPVPLPDPDFSQGMVVLVARRFESGGYDLFVESVEVVGDTLLASYIIAEPGTSCRPAMGITYPYHAVIVRPAEGTPVFQTSRTPYSCELP